MVSLPAEGAVLTAFRVLIETRTVLVELMLVEMAAMLVVIAVAVEIIEAGSVVNSPLFGTEVACGLISVATSLPVFVFVLSDVAGVGESESMAGVLAGTSVVIGEEVCCEMSVSTTDDNTMMLEVEDDDISLIDSVESTILDTADSLVGDTCASLVGDADPSLDEMDED